MSSLASGQTLRYGGKYAAAIVEVEGDSSLVLTQTSKDTMDNEFRKSRRYACSIIRKQKFD